MNKQNTSYTDLYNFIKRKYLLLCVKIGALALYITLQHCNDSISPYCMSNANCGKRRMAGGGTRIIFWRGVWPEVWNPYPYLRIFLPQKTADLKLFFEIFANRDPFLRVFLQMADFTIFSRFLRNGTLF